MDVPFGSDTFERPPHQRVLIQDSVEVIHWQWKEIAVRFSPDTGHTSGIGQQTDLTEIGAITQTGRHFTVTHHNVDNTFLDKVHFGTDGGFFDDDVTWKIIKNK